MKEEFINKFPILKGNKKNPYIVLFDAFTGQGKTYVSNIISKLDNSVILNNDEVRDFLGDYEDKNDLKDELQRYRLELMLDNNNSCIMDSCFSHNWKDKKKYYDTLGYNYYIIRLVCSDDIVKERLDNRIDDYAIANYNDYLWMRDNVNHVDDELVDFIINTEKDIEPQVQEFLKYIKFDNEINELESKRYDKDYILKKGDIPILFTAAHTMKQVKEDGTIKLNEPYTKAIALYLNKHCNVNCMIKIKDTGIDSNKDIDDEFKNEIIKYVKENNIKLVIDLHGSSKDRNFDIEFGTLNNLTADYSTIKELAEAFIENGINNIVHNDPFKGGAITKYLFNKKEIDVIQLEINGKYRDYNNLDELEKVCESLRRFIKQYNDYTK